MNDMIQDIDNILRDLKCKLQNKYKDFVGLYLYGSYAKGTATNNSDVDVVALFNNEVTRKEKYSIYDILMELEYKLDILIDFHPMSIKELQNNPLYFSEVTNNGVFYE